MEEIQCPSNRLSVRHQEIELIQPRSVLFVSIARHCPVDGERRSCEWMSFARRCGDAVHRRLVIYCIDQEPDNVLLPVVDHRANVALSGSQRSRPVSAISATIAEISYKGDQAG